MIKNFEYKAVSVILTLIALTIIIASWSSRAYVPMYSATSTLNFPNIGPGEKSDLTMTVTGSAVGDALFLGVPNSSVPANGVFMAWVSATNTVTVRFINNDPVANLDPASGAFKISIIKQ